MRAVAVGTGTAIANAKKGDGDILIVHSKLDELNFIEEGFGVERFDLMYNDFIIVGPKNDPANISNKKDIADVMKQLASSKYKFISRDDNSGTHKKELLLWKIAGLQVPKDNSYLKTGSSMANAINVAAEMQAYLLTDRGTWISFKNKNNLKILFEKNESLFNPYGVIAINPKKFPHVEYQKSKKFIKNSFINKKVKMDANITVMIAIKKTNKNISSYYFNDKILGWAAMENSKKRFVSNNELWTLQSTHNWANKKINKNRENKELNSKVLIDKFFKLTEIKKTKILFTLNHGWKYSSNSSPLKIKSYWNSSLNL